MFTKENNQHLRLTTEIFTIKPLKGMRPHIRSFTTAPHATFTNNMTRNTIPLQTLMKDLDKSDDTHDLNNNHIDTNNHI